MNPDVASAIASTPSTNSSPTAAVLALMYVRAALRRESQFWEQNAAFLEESIDLWQITGREPSGPIWDEHCANAMESEAALDALSNLTKLPRENK